MELRVHLIPGYWTSWSEENIWSVQYSGIGWRRRRNNREWVLSALFGQPSNVRASTWKSTVMMKNYHLHRQWSTPSVWRDSRQGASLHQANHLLLCLSPCSPPPPLPIQCSNVPSSASNVPMMAIPSISNVTPKKKCQKNPEIQYIQNVHFWS